MVDRRFQRGPWGRAFHRSGAAMKKAALLSSIRESSDQELKDRIKRLEEELFQSRLKRYTNQLENTNLIRSARREIARCRTVLSARAQGQEQAQAKQAAASEGEK
jgi:ribosomal protein L29